jgi:hypothetical protein
MLNRPEGLEPVIITPGIEKYRKTHEEPFRSTMTRADAALRSASAFLCVGYGFNDQHLQTLLVERCIVHSVPLVLITQKITGKSHELLQGGRLPRYMALEESDGGTRIFANEVPAGVEIPGAAFWRLDEFLKLIM